MAKFYLGSGREVRVGDEVICHGVCDGYDIEGLRATVRIVDDGATDYLCNVRFALGQNARYSTYWVHPENVTHKDDEGRVDIDKLCYCCGAVLPKKSVLGSRLFKNARMCDDCIAKSVAKVHGYHNAKSYRYNVDPDKLTFGFECEIDAPYNFDYNERDGLVEDCVGYARKNNYPLIMSYENDGSLREGGVECVSAPLTIDDFKRPEIVNQIKYLFESADGYGFNFDPDNHAGLHIHIGRKSLCGDDMEISNAVGLLMGWAITRLWDKGFDDLSGRTNLEYTRLYDADGECDGNGLNDTYARSDRYYCVNISNAKTIEMRIFNNAVCYEDIIVAVDVCRMLAKWASKKINAFLKRGSYSAKCRDFTDALAYADRISWDALIKYSKFPEITLPRLKVCGIKFSEGGRV